MGRNRVVGSPLQQQVVTDSFTTDFAVDLYLVDAPVGAPVTVTLDPHAVQGDTVIVVDFGGNSGSQPIPITASPGQSILGMGSTVSIGSDFAGLTLTFNQANGVWVPTSSQSSSAVLPLPASGFGSAGLLGPLGDSAETQLATVTITPTVTGVFLLIATTLASNTQVGGTPHNYALSLHDTSGGNFFSQNAVTVASEQIVQGDIQFMTSPNPVGEPITFAVFATTDHGGVPPAGGPMFSVDSQLTALEIPPGAL